MIKLDTQFVSAAGGFGNDPLTYNQIARTDKIALYERSRDGKIVDYEVFQIKITPKGRINKFPNGTTSVVEDDTEMYPGSSAFGRSAWSFGGKPGALTRFQKLCSESVETTEESVATQALTVPVMKFTVGEFAESNKVDYTTAYLAIKSMLVNGSVKLIGEERRNAKGKASKIFAKV